MSEALFHLELASEYSDGEDPDVRTRLLGDRWQFMWGMRNRIAHGYLLVDSDIVRKTIEIDLPGIVQVVKRKIPGV